MIVRIMSQQNLCGLLNFSTIPLSFLLDFDRSSVKFYTLVVNCLTLASISLTNFPVWLIVALREMVFSMILSTF